MKQFWSLSRRASSSDVKDNTSTITEIATGQKPIFHERGQPSFRKYNSGFANFSLFDNRTLSLIAVMKVSGSFQFE